MSTVPRPFIHYTSTQIPFTQHHSQSELPSSGSKIREPYESSRIGRTDPRRTIAQANAFQKRTGSRDAAVSQAAGTHDNRFERKQHSRKLNGSCAAGEPEKGALVLRVRETPKIV